MSNRDLIIARNIMLAVRLLRSLLAAFLLLILLQGLPYAVSIGNQTILTGPAIVQAQACAANLTPASLSGDYVYGGNTYVTVSTRVSWQNPPASEQIQVQLVDSGGTVIATRNIAMTYEPISGQPRPMPALQEIAFEIPADGATGYEIRAGFTGGTCDAAPVEFDSVVGYISPVCNTANNDIGGMVFKDFDLNGVRSGGETVGVENITVTIFGSDGSVTPLATDRYGYYHSTLSPAAYPVRVEFSNIPQIPYYSTSTPYGSDNETTVQFINSPACDVDLGVNNPSDFCQTNPDIMTSCFVNGDPLAGGDAASMDTIVSFSYDIGGTSVSDPAGHKDMANMSMLSVASQTGSVWGLSYDSHNDKLYSAAFVRRHTGLGPLGPGGIYVTDYTPDSDGSPGAIGVDGWDATGVTTNFIDVTQISDTDGTPVNVGSLPSNADRGLSADKNAPSYDPAAYDGVGKFGLGDMDITENGNALWVTNLHEKTLIEIPLNANGTAPTSLTSHIIDPNGLVSCNNGEMRPFAINIYEGKIFSGVVCTAEHGGIVEDLSATVLKYDPATGQWSKIFDLPLTYPKGYGAESRATSTGWYPWVETWDEITNNTFGGDRVSYPQPLLSDIEFDIDGSMVLGFADRGGYQMGTDNYATDPSISTAAVYGYAVAGDVLRAFYAGGGAYVLENNAKAGAFNGARPNNNQGPGLGEFYDDNYHYSPHTETVIGGLAIRPGSGETLGAVMDAHTSYSNGIRWWNNTTGNWNRNYTVYRGLTGEDARYPDDGVFAKAAGLGDIELACSLPQILEIGNRIWEDTDADGIQDPNENPIANVSLILYDSAGNMVSTTTTNGNGEWYFDLNDGLLPNQDYYVVVDPAEFTSGDLQGLAPTQLFASSSLRDNNAQTLSLNNDGNLPANLDFQVGLYATTGGYGENNHTFDMGFTDKEFVTIGDTVWRDLDSDGRQDSGEPGVGGVTVTLYDGNGNILNTTTTNANGKYAFTTDSNGDLLTAGDYQVGFTPPPGYELTVADAVGNTLDSDADTTPGPNYGLTPVFNMQGGETDLTWDAGLISIMSIGSTVFFDIDNNGIHDGLDYGIPNVTVQLMGLAGNVIATDVTDANGDYFFGNLEPGQYQVKIPQPSIAAPLSSTDISTTLGDNQVDGDDNGRQPAGNNTAVTSPIITLTGDSEPTGESGQAGNQDGPANSNSDTNGDMTVDFGFVPILMEIGNRVWFDTDNSADMNGGEQGVAGVTLTMLKPDGTPFLMGGGVPVTTTTDANGYYTFTTVMSGTYKIQVDPENFQPGGPLDGYVSSDGPNEEAQPNNDGDMNDNGVGSTPSLVNGIISNNISLTPNSEPMNEPDNPAAEYSDDNANDTVDFGFYKLTVGNQIWDDSNNDGDIDPGELGIPNIPVAIIDVNTGQVVQTTTTDSNGYYNFDGLVEGTYRISATLPSGYKSSMGAAQEADPDSNVDHNDNGLDTPVNGSFISADFDLVANSPGAANNNIIDSSKASTINPTVDMGFTRPLSVGDTVWHDINNNGILDPGEQGINNVAVELYQDSNGDGSYTPGTDTLVGSTTTNASGVYSFTQLISDTYVIVLPSSNFSGAGPLADYRSSDTDEADPDRNVDDNDNGLVSGTLGAGGYVTSGAIDLNYDDEPDGGANGIDGDSDPNTNWTVDFGFYQADFGDAPSSYGTTLADNGPRHIQDGVTFLGSSVDAEPDGQPNNSAEGDDTLSGSDVADDEDGVTFLTPIMAGQPFTIEVVANTTGYLNSWIDFDGNGTFDPGEQFTSDQLLAPGVNTLTFTAPATVDDDNLYSRFRFTADSGEITGPLGQAATGEVEDYVLMSLGDTVWLDNGAGSPGGTDANNGTQDGTEAGIPGVTVELYRAGDTPGIDAPMATTTTTANGEYLFTGLVPGDYNVYLPPSNFANGALLEDHFSSSDPGGVAVDPDNNQDGDDNGVGGGLSDPVNNGILSSPVTLALGQEPTGDGDGNHSNRTVDFGLVQYDKGDLPDSNVGEAPGDYETLTSLGHDGARHVIVPDVFLGSSVDAEADGQPTVGADGDNIANSNDEDGVLFTSLLIPGQNATVDVDVNVDGYLNAWIDFNGDGDFNDPGEQIAADTPLSAGINNLTYPVPNGQLASDLYTRFRFTSDDPAGQLGPNGAWNNGEVEDYVLEGVSLGNQVWHDLDDDGVRDTAEPALDGVLVNLIDPATGTVIMTDTTANGGYYIFDNLLGSADHHTISGDYIVEIDASNFAAGGPLEGMYSSNPTEADPNADIDLNDNGINPPSAVSYQQSGVQSGIVTLSNGDETIYESWFGPNGHGNADDDSSNLTVDFGFYLPVTVGDTVFYDHDKDGVQDGAITEPGVPGIDVTLYNSITGQPVLDSAGNPVTATTNANGEYLFEGLPPGRYHVEFDLTDLPQNYVVTAPHVGSNISVDSNANPSSGTTDSTPFLYSGAEDLTLDMGIVLNENVRVGDRVWFDDNKDGIQDAGEAGVPTVTVMLYDTATGQPILDSAGNPMTTVTDAGGNYLFDELPPGDYYVGFDLSTLPQNYLVTVQDAGSDDVLDSDADPSTGLTAPTGQLNSGDQDLSLDLGIYRLDNVQVGDRVWYDDNRDGIQDAGEAGVENVTVTLYDTASGQPILDALGNPMTDVTDANGEYLFEDLPPGDYYVVFDLNTLPQNYTPTAQDAGGDDGLDSDADPVSGATAPTGMLNSNEEDLSLDMGIHRSDNVMVGDLVWYDNDRDGVQDGPQNGLGELGVENVGVTLYDAATGQPILDAAGNPMTDVTDVNGEYLFTDLPPGDYYVAFDLATLPQNYTPTTPNVGNDGTDSDANPATGETANTGFLNSNEQDLSLDMGIHRLENVRVGDLVWYDDDRDGIQDANEAGVPNVLATLYDTATGQPILDPFGVPMVDLTDNNGEYLFQNLPPGDYYVEFQLNTLPTDYVVTQPNQGSDDMLDSDADPSTGRTGATGFLISDGEDLSLDMGIYRPEGVRVGDYVWLDNNRDGIQDGNEVGVSGVTVTLVDSAGVPVTQDRDGNPITPQVTDSNGYYLFDNLPEGEYGVVFDLATLPANHAVTVQDATNDQQPTASDQFDSDADPATGATPTTGLLTEDSQDLSLDMGIYPLSEVQVGDRVWYDNNGDGLQGNPTNEPGVSGVIVNLFNADGTPVTDLAGNPVGPTATDADGNYLFENLPAGDYYVEFDLSSLPIGYLPTVQDATSNQPSAINDQQDSDADPVTGQTASTGPLADGEQDMSLDMGIVAPVSVGNTVWYDNDGDGLQGNPTDEPGVEGVTVNLFNAAPGAGQGTSVTDMAGNLVGPTTTDADGNYLFENLPPGDYYVAFDLSTLPNGYVPTSANATSGQPSAISDQLDSDANPSTGETASTGFLSAGSSDMTLDMGIVQPTGVQIGDYVWFDDNQDGIQNVSEAGVPGVIVNLFNSDGSSVTDLAGNPVGPTMTNADGNYLFENLPEGNYYVEFDLSSLPADSMVTVQDVGGDDGADSDVDPVTGQTAPTGVLTAGDADLSLDMGIYRPEPENPEAVEIGDRVWFDADQNGIQDAGETGVPGVVVNLFNADGTPVTDLAGNPVGPTTTGANGNYLFENLPEGNYYVEFDLSSLPADYQVTQQDATNNQSPATSDQSDSDVDPVTGQTAPTGVLTAGDADLSLDMGIYRPEPENPEAVEIGDRVWFDADQNGIQDAGETGVPGVVVNLFNVDGTPVTDLAGNPVGPTTTGANGNYLFENLPEGNYYVEFELSSLPADSMVTVQDAGGDDGADSDVDPVTGQTAPTGVLTAGDADLSLDMGIYRPEPENPDAVEIGDRVWFDADQNGIQDAGETGVPGMVVNLFNADGTPVTDLDGNPVGPTTTGANGNYLFENLPEGNYYVAFDLSSLPADSMVTVQDAGGDDGADSDVDPVTGQTAPTGVLAAGDADLSLDMGIYRPELVDPEEGLPASIGDSVWEDLDADGIQDGPQNGLSESGIEGVVVELFNSDGTPVTDMDGNPVGPTTTDANGNYLFENLSPGDYYIVFTAPEGYSPSPQDASSGQPSAVSDAQDSDADPITGQTTVTTLSSGENDPTWDAGFYQAEVVVPQPEPEAVTIGNQVWYDNDGDGVQDDGLDPSSADEPGVEGVTVTLFNADGTLATDLSGDIVEPQMTDADGNYLFENLPEGDYYVVFDLGTLPDGYQATQPNANDQSLATNDQDDSDGDPVTGRTENTGFLAGGTEDLTLDLGIVAPATIGDRVWYDYDGDGVQGDPADEPGVEGVTVILLNADGTLVTDLDGLPVEPVVTDSNGNYLFENLAPGDYQVLFDLDTLPENHVVTVPNSGQLSAISDQEDSDADPETGLTPPTGFLMAGDADASLDMGILPIPEVVVGDRVWFDNNQNGIQDGDESGVDGVRATLFNADGSPAVALDGNPVAPQLTDSSGNYLFENLPAGNYYVVFDPNTVPDVYTVTEPNATNDQSPATSDRLEDDQVDSDVTISADGELQTEFTGLLPAGSEDLTLDMGLVREAPVSVGDRVWYDNNGDGIQGDANDEPGVEGVSVNIFNADGTVVVDVDGNPVGPVVTDGNGEYRFENLPPGDYRVQYDLSTLPNGYTVTAPNMGSDTQDSDANPSTGETDSTGFLASGSEDLSLDMGIVQLDPTVRVGDRVWLDENQNGLQDTGESGVPGVSVMLYNNATDTLLETTVTDADGNYLFDELEPGDYYVQFDLDTIPDNYAVTIADGGDDTLDSDADPETGITPSTGILFTDEEDLSLDMGLYLVEQVKVGDRVWYDVDGDGIQDPEESGVENVTVTLFDVDTGRPVDVPPQQTDSNGEYLFEDLPAGSYFVEFDLETIPLGYGVTEPNAISDQPSAISDQSDSDADPASGKTAATPFLSGDDEDRTLDMGIVVLPGVTVGDSVWFDDNGDGIQDPTEDGVPGVSVTIYDQITGEQITDSAGQPLIQVTDGNGEYLFEDLPSGQYYVQFDLDTIPEGHVVSPQDQDGSDTADSDADGETGITPPTAFLTHGDSDHTLDMGIYQPISIGNQVWLDDGDGQQDGPQNGLDEAGVPDVTVMLYDAETGQELASTVTDENGNYLFDNLPPGNYYVGFDPSTLPEGTMPTVANVGDDNEDSDVDPTSPILQTPPTGFLSSGETDLSLDFGLVYPVEIGDTVWFDDDLDGVQDDGELGVEGVTVTLYDGTGAPIATTTTDSEGQYHFGGLQPGDYYVVFDLETLPEGYIPTLSNVGSDNLDSDVNPENGHTPNTGFLPSGTVVNNLDMGIRIPDEELVQIGGQLWEDEDLDSEIDPDEPVWSEIPVTLYSQDDPETPIATVLTDDNGEYFFENLPPGDYFVVLDNGQGPEGALPPIYYNNSGADDLRGNTGTLDEGEGALNTNIALNLPGSLSGVAWQDANGDGVQSSDEPSFSNITAILYDALGEEVGRMPTGEDGSYHFENLIPGEYVVEFTDLQDWNISPGNQDNDDTRDSDADRATAQTAVYFVGSGDHVPHVDIGLYEGASITNVIWNDANGDNVQDADEQGIPNVTVFLFNADGEVVAETMTDSEGRYGFSGLPADDYYAGFVPPSDLTLVTPIERDDNLVLGPMVPLQPGEVVSALDIGFTQPSALGSFVWLDTDKDGLFDPDEAGIAGAIVRLLDGTGAVLDATTTDSDGHFEFVVSPGEYQLEFLNFNGLEFTMINQGDDSTDSDVDPETGRTAVIPIGIGETDFSQFAGFIVSPTAIQLISFSATEGDAGVTVEWMTGAEIDTFGFHILRSRDGSLANAVQLTDEQVAAQGGDGVYTFIDTYARRGQVYSYWLVETQTDGVVYEYGPTSLMVESAEWAVSDALPLTRDGVYTVFLPLVEK